VTDRAHFPAGRSSIPRARRFARAAIEGATEELAATIALIVSELATNSVRHAASSFDVRIERFGDHIRIEVEDDGDGQPVMRSPGVRATSGRGLQIVQALADDWGVLAKPDPPGKTVWATISVDTIGVRTTHVVKGQHGADPVERGSGAAGSEVNVRPVDSTVPFARSGARAEDPQYRPPRPGAWRTALGGSTPPPARRTRRRRALAVPRST
jgi:anti-sigma regulatory factor (Ser/Thr protein kinase)